MRKYTINDFKKYIDNKKEVYKKGDERFSRYSEDGEEKEEIDSEWNEALNYLINNLNDLTQS